MPRDLPLSNGTLLVNFDQEFNLRDIYFPHIGQENHSAGHRFRFGIWVNGGFSWVGPEWQTEMDYLDDTLITNVRAENPALKVVLTFNGTVDFRENIFIRKVTVENLSSREIEARLFFYHDFHILENAVGDTALYEPHTRTLTHYKSKRYFVINCQGQGRQGIEDYACGQKEHTGYEGTWRDCEDGVLSRNPIAQGSVDSAVGFTLRVPAGACEVLYYWMAVGVSWDEAYAINQSAVDLGPESFLERTRNYWKLWVNKERTYFADLPPRVVDLYKRSLLILRTHIDANGAIVAATDSDILRFNRDTYSYVWPRDGAIVARALDMAGYRELARSFFAFCAEVISDGGYFLHKYNPDGSIGSSWQPWVQDGQPQLPIQEDETALVVWALWHHFRTWRDVEFVTNLYESVVKPAANFMVDYRDPETRLPRPSYDLWEEKLGVSTFTASTVYAGLRAARSFADSYGETRLAEKYRRAADEIKSGMDKYLYNNKLNRFIKMLEVRPGGKMKEDLTLDSSLYSIFAFGPYDVADERVVNTMRAVLERLWCRTWVGGMARYENDYYQQISRDTDKVPGNPWIVCSLWLAQYYIARSRSAEGLQDAINMLDWVASRALKSGVLAEQLDPNTGDPVSVSPLSWSHATYIMTVLECLKKLEA